MQARKILSVQRAFQAFNDILRMPGKGELTMYELTVRPICSSITAFEANCVSGMYAATSSTLNFQAKRTM